MDAGALARGRSRVQETRGVHGAQRGPVSITQATEKGAVYSLDADRRRRPPSPARYGLAVHMDGARFANALVALGCTPAEMTWKAGVDARQLRRHQERPASASRRVVFFDPAHAWEFELRRKRGAHLFSKHRYLSAQMAAYLDGDLWLDMARAANAATVRLLRGLRQRPEVRIQGDPRANIVFAAWPRAAHRRLHAGGRVVLHLGRRARRTGRRDADGPARHRLVRNRHRDRRVSVDPLRSVTPMKPILITLTLFLSATAASAGRLDDKLTASDPCQDLPQISETEAVTLERATLTILPETAEMTVAGRIACRSPQGAMLASSASTRVEAEVTLNIEDCTATRSEVELSDFEGNLGPLVEAFAAQFQQDLSSDLARAVEDECRDNFD